MSTVPVGVPNVLATVTLTKTFWPMFDGSGRADVMVTVLGKGGTKVEQAASAHQGVKSTFPLTAAPLPAGPPASAHQLFSASTNGSPLTTFWTPTLTLVKVFRWISTVSAEALSSSCTPTASLGVL